MSYKEAQGTEVRRMIGRERSRRKWVPAATKPEKHRLRALKALELHSSFCLCEAPRDSKNPCVCLHVPSPSRALSVRFSSVAQLCLTLCDPMNRSTPGLPVHHQLLEFTQTHVHRVSDAIQPSHPLSSPSPPAPNPSQHQGLFQ